MQKKLTPVLAVLLVIAIVCAAVFGVQKNDLTAENTKLQEELAASKTNADALAAELEAAAADLAAAKADLETAAANAAEQETKVAELTAKEEQTAADLTAAQTEAGTVKTELETAKADLEAVKAELETAKADLEAAKAELETAKADLEASVAKVAELEAALTAAEAEAAVEEPAAEAPAAEGPATQAFLMFADGAWVNQVWNAGETPAGMTVTEATITGEGDYTVGLAFEAPAEGIAFAALGIADGENLYPDWKIKINEIRVNGQAIEAGKGYTSSDDGIVTRMNIFNEWVGELPADARSFDGNVADANWVIVNKDDFASAESIEVDFSFIKLGIDTAYIMYADTAWAQQYWLDGNEYPVIAKNATVTGAGDYTVGLDFTVSEAGKASGVAFAALGIKYGENLFPGMMIKLNEVRINGAAVEFGKGYTSSDDGIETRMNLMNEWVTDVPADARSWDGTTEDASPIVIAKDLLAEVETIEIDFSLIPVTDTAFLMFADSNWAVQAWNPGEYAETNAVKVEGPGTYKLALEFAEPLPGFAFLAAGIATGEQTFPGYFMDITEVKINGAAIEIGKDFTTSDEGITTRSNIWNEWVTDLPEQARIADGNLEGATAMIATKEALSNVTSIEVTFDFIYGEPPAAEGPAPLTEEQVAEMIAADYHGYVAVQSENYIFRNDFEDPTYGRDGEQADFFTHLVGWDAENNAIDYGGSFEDCTITGNGTYTVTMTTGDMGFGTDTFFRYFRVATDIPAQLVKEGHVTITDVKVKFGEGKTQEGLTVWTDGDWVKLVVCDEYNHVEAPFGYNVPGPGTSVVFTFTVNGLAD